MNLSQNVSGMKSTNASATYLWTFGLSTVTLLFPMDHHPHSHHAATCDSRPRTIHTHNRTEQQCTCRDLRRRSVVTASAAISLESRSQ
jgi:hypothetical protein